MYRPLGSSLRLTRLHFSRPRRSQQPVPQELTLTMPSVVIKKSTPDVRAQKRYGPAEKANMVKRSYQRGGGPAGYLRSPSMVKAQGKRHA